MYTVGKVSYAIKNDKRGNPPPNPTIGTRNTARFDGRFVSKTGDKEWDEASKDQRKTIVKDLVREQTKLKRNQRDRERRAPDRNEKENGKDDEPVSVCDFTSIQLLVSSGSHLLPTAISFPRVRLIPRSLF